MSIKKHQSVPDENGQFRLSLFTEIAESSLANEKTTHFQLNNFTSQIPQHLNDEIQARIDKQMKNEMADLQKEDCFMRTIHFMPNAQKMALMRNTTRTCGICGGPHGAAACPMRQQQKLMVDRPVVVSLIETTYSVKLEPLPTGWERGNLIDFISQTFLKVRERQSAYTDKMVEISKKISEAKTEQESAILSHNKKTMQDELDVILKALDASQPRVIKVLTDRRNKNVRYSFIHFKNKEAAEIFAKMRDQTRIDADNVIMHSLYMGEHKKK